MSGGNNLAPIIIKRKKIVGGDGHHGGAWKVAYADFVTAMMAFFLLMWLLNATTEKQRKGIADYFSPTIALTRVSGGGNGSLGGHSVFSEQSLPQVGTGATSLRPTESKAARGTSADTGKDKEAEEAFKEVDAKLMGRGGDSLLDDNMLRHVETRLTDEGMIIEFFDLPGSPLFLPDDTPTELMRSLMRAMARAADYVPNAIAVEAHTQAFPLVLNQNPVWASSAERAQETRNLLRIFGVPEQRILRVTAHADKEIVNANPMSERNNRLEIILLRQEI